MYLYLSREGDVVSRENCPTKNRGYIRSHMSGKMSRKVIKNWKNELGNGLSVLDVFLHAAWRHHQVDSSLEVTVEGDRIEIKCPMNSSHGVVWRYYNATSAYTIYEEDILLRNFEMDYNVTNINNSLHRISCLTITQVKKSNAGTYICLNYENLQQIVTSVDLVLLSKHQLWL